MEMSNDKKNGMFKYQEQIDKLLAEGCQLPELFMPNNQQACRFVFSEEGHSNHIPQYMSNPKRMLQDIGCDLNKTFHITKILKEEKQDEKN